jgi:endonuclease G
LIWTIPTETGFDKDFLGSRLSLPKLNDKQLVDASKLKGSDDILLKYHHYSLVMNAKRKLPFFTAVNIDGIKYNKLRDSIPSRREIGQDAWFWDDRINRGDQLDKKFYKNNEFDLGHLVRREDSLWGDNLKEALDANNDSFHQTNAAPQHSGFNREAERWKGLEDYILRNSRNKDQMLKVNVFSGPVFSENDLVFGQNGIEVQVPAKFWKVITMVKEDGGISSTGYMISQYNLIEDMEKEGFQFGQFRTYQRPISFIERATGLDFGLSQYDPMFMKKNLVFTEGNPVETKSRLISAFNDIIL